MDSNPYKSPPPELLAEGISTVMQYVRVRMQRIDRMYNLILGRCEKVFESTSPQRALLRIGSARPTWCVLKTSKLRVLGGGLSDGRSKQTI